MIACLPQWTARMAEIRGKLEGCGALLVRQDVEGIFGVSRAQAHRIMVRAGGKQRPGVPMAVSSAMLLAFLHRFDGVAAREAGRAAALREKLAQGQAEARLRSIGVTIHYQRDPAPTFAELDGVTLEPGKLVIQFQGRDHLLLQLFRLARAIGADEGTFTRLAEGGVR